MLLSLLFACSDVEKPHDHDHDHEHEVMTTVVLTLTSASDGSESSFSFVDLQDGSDATVDPIFLEHAVRYEVDVTIFNELEDPAEEVTPEILDEDDEHQVFFTGDVSGCSDIERYSHEYLDEDANGLPVGLSSSVVGLSDGTGEMIVSLRHMPTEDGESVKVEGLADEMCAGNEAALPGAWDFSVTFPLEVGH